MNNWKKIKIEQGRVYVGEDYIDSIPVSEFDNFGTLISSLNAQGANLIEITEFLNAKVDDTTIPNDQLDYNILNAAANEVIGKQPSWFDDTLGDDPSL
tara:strand:+ start:160 stop:453 length:294 start_codon:yes stop_codon:yes gene_type:complete